MYTLMYIQKFTAQPKKEVSSSKVISILCLKHIRTKCRGDRWERTRLIMKK